MWYCSQACCGLGQDIFDCFPKQCDSPVHLDCNQAKIDCSDETVSFSSPQRRAPRSGMIAAKAPILFEWKSASHPVLKGHVMSCCLWLNLNGLGAIKAPKVYSFIWILPNIQCCSATVTVKGLYTPIRIKLVLHSPSS